MNEITKANIDQRLNDIRGQLGQLAYDRRGYMIAVEKIDLQVAQMEAQAVLLEATKKDLMVDENNEAGRQEAEKAHAKEERSKRATDAAKKRKGTTPKATTRKGKAAAKA